MDCISQTVILILFNDAVPTVRTVWHELYGKMIMNGKYVGLRILKWVF